jgi:uncharacterized protein YaeQ
MANGSTLYRFRIVLSDVERAVYESLDFRVAMHPSESEEFLVTRVFAYVLNYEDGLAFSPGLAEPDEPAIRLLDSNGTIAKWIDIGNPSARRIHKASKACKHVKIYTYKDPDVLKKEISNEGIHRADQIEIFSFEPKFLQSLVDLLGRDNHWTVMLIDGELVVTQGEKTWMSPLRMHRLDPSPKGKK